MGFIFVVMALVLCVVVGWQLGARSARAKSSGRGTVPSALAQAWQEGFHAGRSLTDPASSSAPATGAPGGPTTAPAPPEPFQPPANPLRVDEDDIRSVVPRAVDAERGAGRSVDEPSEFLASTPALEEAAMAHRAPDVPHPAAGKTPSPRSAQEREKATLRNINITLYAASLLLVAAASLFIGLAVPPLAKFGGLVVVTTLFYAGGLLIHAFSERLRPAGIAFAGTGLALIPVSGLALSALVVHDPVMAWWITSLVGTVAFVHAAARLNSRVVAYLSLTFLVSSAWAGGAVLNRGLFWYFMFSMVLAAAGTALAYGRPRWLGNIYLRAFAETHRFLAPATLLIAVLVGQALGAEDVSLLLIAGFIYYVAVTVFGPTTERAVNLIAARLCGTAAIVLLAHVFGAGAVGMARGLGIVLLLQSLAVHRAGERYRRFVAPQVRRLVDREVQGLLLAVAGLALVMNETLVVSLRIPKAMLDMGTDTGWTPVNFLLPLVALTAAGLSTRGRKLPPWIALGTGVAAMLEPGAVLSPWRQVAFLAVGLACMVPGLRHAVGRQLLWLRRGIVAVLPTTLAAIAAWAAGGFLITRSAAGPGLGAWISGDPGQWADGGTDPRVVMLIAGLVFVMCWMAAAALAAWKLESGFMLAGIAVVVAAEVRLGSLESGGTPWTTAVAVSTLVLAAVGSNALLATLGRGRGRTARRKTAMAHAVAPVAVVATWGASFGIDSPWLVFTVCLTGLGHAAWRLAAARGPLERLAYAVAAQLFFSLSVLELSHQLQADAHARWALFAISLAMGQSARFRLRGRGQGATPTAYGPMVAQASLALLFLTPLVYVGLHGGSGPGAGVDMASLLVQFVCLLVVGLLKWRVDLTAAATASIPWRIVARMQILVVAYALAWMMFIPSGVMSVRQAGWLPEPWWNSTVLLILLLVTALLVMVFEALGPETSLRLRMTGVLAGEEGRARLVHPGSGPEGGAHPMARGITVACYLGVAAAVVLGAGGTSGAATGAPVPGGDAWLAATLLAAAAGCAVFGVTTGLPLLLIGAVVFLPWAVFVALVQWAGRAGSAMELSALYMASALGSAILLYAAGWFRRPRRGGAPRPITTPRSWSWLHARILSAGAVLLIFIDGFEANVMQSGEPNSRSATILAYLGTAMIVVAAVATVAEVPRRYRERCSEAAALVVAGGAQHAWHLANGQPGLFWMTQYWVVVLALLAAYELKAGRRKDADYPLIASAVLLSVSAPFGLAVEQEWGQGWLLLGHVLLLSAGLLLNRRLYVVWGTIAAALLVLWFLRGFTILLLAVLAAGLIALAIWRLQRLGKDKDAAEAARPVPEGPDAAPPASRAAHETDLSAPGRREGEEPADGGRQATSSDW
ncbi:MAG: hypothetical protein L0H47_05070 [Micrococcaceae bacterium]|nr:hypothetical protein [Micrococcaceae bacterium]